MGRDGGGRGGEVGREGGEEGGGGRCRMEVEGGKEQSQ